MGQVAAFQGRFSLRGLKAPFSPHHNPDLNWFPHTWVQAWDLLCLSDQQDLGKMQHIVRPSDTTWAQRQVAFASPTSYLNLACRICWWRPRWCVDCSISNWSEELSLCCFFMLTPPPCKERIRTAEKSIRTFHTKGLSVCREHFYGGGIFKITPLTWCLLYEVH